MLLLLVTFFQFIKLLISFDNVKKNKIMKDGNVLMSLKNTVKYPNYYKRYGEFGKNYYIDENLKPYIFCENYDSSNCLSKNNANECLSVKKCYDETSSHELRCMAALIYNYSMTSNDNFATNNSLLTQINFSNASAVLKGCWSQFESELSECNTENVCIANIRRMGLKEQTTMFCCCKTHNCNSNMFYKVFSKTAKVKVSESHHLKYNSLEQLEFYLSIALIIFLFICLCFACCFFIYTLRKKLLRQKKFIIKQLFASNVMQSCSEEKDELITMFNGKKTNLQKIRLTEIISNGRFGQVYKAYVDELCLAVKIFLPANLDSWVCEQDFYSIEAIKLHPNIASFIAAFSLNKSFWILSMFYEKGSLYDHLKNNIISLQDLSKMGYSMMNGLAFLHEEIKYGTCTKPIIVHRDFKSKNILLKNDLTVCITNFEIAMKCEQRQISFDGTHGQIGTRRYMSPELLEGAMEFSSFAFQQSDVYAASLVLWELLSRTHITNLLELENVSQYYLPYEVEIGLSPTLAEMRNLVVFQQYRPKIQKLLYQNEFTNAIIKTMTEMWEKEPDARITSGCARDRMFCISKAIVYYTINKSNNYENVTKSQESLIHSSTSTTLLNTNLGCKTTKEDITLITTDCAATSSNLL